MSETWKEVRARGMLLGMNYDVNDHTFDRPEEDGYYLAESMEFVSEKDYFRGQNQLASMYHHRSNAVERGELGVKKDYQRQYQLEERIRDGSD